MNDRALRFTLGFALLAASVVGVVVNVREYDRHWDARDVPVAPPRDDARATTAPLGWFRVPAPGLVRAVLCPVDPRARLADPRASLDVYDAAGRRAATARFTVDEARGKRCYDATAKLDVAGRVRAEVSAPAGLPAEVRVVEARAARRITPLAAWPVLAMLLGFAAIVAAPRRRAAVAPPGAVAEPPFREPDPPPGLEPGAPPISRWRPPVDRPYSPVVALAAYLGTMFAAGVAAAGYLGVAGASATETGTFYVVTLLVQHGLMVALAAWFLGAFRARDGQGVRDALGVTPVSRQQVLVAVACGVALLALAIATTRLIKDVSQSPMGRLVEIVPVRYAIGFGALLAPLSEELFFRGVLVRACGKRGAAYGIAGATLVFTLAHAMQLTGALIGLVPIASVALVNGWLRVKSGGITQPWIVHTIYNSVLSAGLYLG